MITTSRVEETNDHLLTVAGRQSRRLAAALAMETIASRCHAKTTNDNVDDTDDEDANKSCRTFLITIPVKKAKKPNVCSFEPPQQTLQINTNQDGGNIRVMDWWSFHHNLLHYQSQLIFLKLSSDDDEEDWKPAARTAKPRNLMQECLIALDQIYHPIQNLLLPCFVSATSTVSSLAPSHHEASHQC
jgi:hypothetical protein